jgi:hypothetical protein
MRFLRCAAQVAAVSVMLMVVVSPVHAVTCDEVRGLTTTALSHWAKRLKVTPASLAMVLEQSFCQAKKPSGVIVSARGTNSFPRKSKAS